MEKKEYIIDNPDLMAEWDWEKNDAIFLDPKSLIISSKKKAQWICKKGHTWTTTIAYRSIGGTNCPYCANKKILAGFNDLASQFPQLIEEWDWAKNNKLNIFPKEIYFGIIIHAAVCEILMGRHLAAKGQQLRYILGLQQKVHHFAQELI